MQNDQSDDDSRSAKDSQPPLPVVAIGASAGGLTQLQRLFAEMPADTGAAFVVMLHLSPDHTSELPALLGSKTTLEVVTIEDGMPLVANRVHVLPPGHQPGLADDRLSLTREHAHSAMAGVIDNFFRELADAKNGAAIGIVLSGSGSDGALGAKAIKTHGGLVMVQSPDSAEYDGMPRAAHEAADVDFALDTVELIEPLRNHLRNNCSSEAPARRSDNDARNLVNNEQLHRILELLNERPRHYDFSNYKPNMLRRRIQRRMGLNGLQDIDEYERRLRDDKDERRRLSQDFLISVTDFFRDPDTYETLETEALDKLLDASDANTPLRIWVPGCATGEEAYSIAMCAAEAIEARGQERQFVVFASDIDERALEYARRGLYPESIASDVSETRLRLFFDAVDHHYRVKRRLRERVVFATQDVLRDPPYSSLDLISCRNLLMYLQAESQKRVLTTFHFTLNSAGFLFLGNSETIGEQIDLFEPVVKEQRLFRRIGLNRRRNLDLPFLPQASYARASPDALPRETPRDIDEMEKVTRNILLQEHVPATVLVNRKLEILCSYGPTRDYFTLPVGQTTLGLMEMVHEAYRSPLRAVTHRAFRDDTRSEVTATLYEDRNTTLRMVARPLRRPESARGLMMVIFERETITRAETSQPPAENELESQLYDELEDTRNELQSTIQALEASNEDLKSSNEEILSMNEELQSTNEELETSKEGLQSVNEELITVNDELETKVQELETAHDDLYNLFSGTQLATLFLDRGLRIKRFTPTVRELLSVIDSDIGRPIGDITRKIDDPGLLGDADEVLEDLVPREKEIRGQDDRWYLRRVLPYRTQSDAIEGVVITFTDISDLKQAAMASRESEQRLDLALGTLNGGIWDMELNADDPANSPDRIYISPQLKELLGYKPGQFPDSLEGWRERIVGDGAAAHKDPTGLVSGASHAEQHYRIRHRDGSIRWFSSHGRVISDERGRPGRWIGIDYDITAQKEAEARTRQMQAQLQLLADAIPMLLVYIDHETIVHLVNSACLEWLGRDAKEILGEPLDALLGAETHAAMGPYVQRALAGHTVSNEVAGFGSSEGDDRSAFQVNYIPHVIEGEVLGCYLLLGDGTRLANSRVDQLGNRSGLVYLQRMATIGELASTLAHDLRQPLSAINTYAGAVTRMLHGNKPAEEITPHLRKIADQVNHANEIVSNTRDFVGRRDAGMSEVEINTLVHRAMALTDGVVRNLNVETRLELDSPLPEIQCYAVQIEQVIINLLMNACDAMEAVERSARTLRVCTSSPDSTHVLLTVTDSGEGIPADKIGSIFDAFYTSKLDGMGMGLALSRSIVEGHTGALWAESRLGEGATFHLQLPIQPDMPDHEPAADKD